MKTTLMCMEVPEHFTNNKTAGDATNKVVDGKENNDTEWFIFTTKIFYN